MERLTEGASPGTETITLGRYVHLVITEDVGGRSPSDRRSPYDVDPKLVAIGQQITSMPVDARLRRIEAEASFFAEVRPVDGG